uniref:Uncharacterized protein n=1 Tax=Rhizophora mucronata TaxID=61149 RepID=A0A2P2QAP2_RHIMU
MEVIAVASLWNRQIIAPKAAATPPRKSVIAKFSASSSASFSFSGDGPAGRRRYSGKAVEKLRC